MRITTSAQPKWLKSALIALGVFALLFFVYSCFKSVNDTLKQNQRNDAITDVWRQLLIANATISGTPTNLNEDGVPSFPFISFEASRSKLDIHRNVRLATALPGIRSIGLSPESTRYIGRGHADDSTLKLVAANFRSLDSLSLSGTKVTTLEPLADVQLRELKIINAPIKRDKLASLELLRTVSDLWIGWEADIRDPDQQVFVSESYKRRLIEVLGRMPNLKNLYLYNVTFTTEELKLLPNINMRDLR
ncbi:MAG: hypothetical protein HKN47_23665 [Pirellulaceae bacterium]|nr:hypothetical protein [Pirellulaceae bacterium]